jgi:hypothetical protein
MLQCLVRKRLFPRELSLNFLPDPSLDGGGKGSSGIRGLPCVGPAAGAGPGDKDEDEPLDPVGPEAGGDFNGFG